MKKKETMYYVTMTDKFMSGWGMADGKINKLIFECDSLDDVTTVMENARHRTEMKYINWTDKKPYYNKQKYFSQIKTKTEYPSWYKEDFFK